VATLRSSAVLFRCGVLVTTTIIGCVVIGSVVIGSVAGRGVVRAAEPSQTKPPAKLRLPSWIESIGSREEEPLRNSGVKPAAAHSGSSGSRSAAGRRDTSRTAGPSPRMPAWITERLNVASGARTPPAAVATPGRVTGRSDDGTGAVNTAGARTASASTKKPTPQVPMVVGEPASLIPLAETQEDAPGGLRGDTPGGLRGDSTGGLRGDSTGGLRGDEPAPVASAGSETVGEMPLASTEGDLPLASTDDGLPTLAIDAASFRGVLPGKTTRAEVEADWGPGETLELDGNDGVTWAIEPFERVELSFRDNVVTTIRIKLADPVPVTDLARQLEISDLRTVTIFDDEGQSVGEVYPERGVILSLKPQSRSVNAIMIEPLDPDAFVLRAEGQMEKSLAGAAADLVYALSIDPDHAQANRLLMVLKAEAGQRDEALRLANTALSADPEDVWTQLKQAGLLVAVENTDQAFAMLADIRGREGQPALVAAQVERLLGRAALVAIEPDHQAAVEHFAESIRRAGPLLGKPPAMVQAAAAEIVLDAHLGTALAIARGTWQEKSRVLPKWVSRAEAIVDDFQGSDLERSLLELRLCQGVLAAAAGTDEAIEPMPWVKRLLAAHERMSGMVSDPWRRRPLDWDVGRGLNDALVAAQKRGDLEDMLDNATLTAAYLERGAVGRNLNPTELREYGDLLFRIGILYSLQRGDHATAVAWFDKSLPLWQEAGDLVGDIGRVGEACVSMAISYWQVDRRDEALTLSRRGVELMVEAVDEELLEERALAIAYGNLATMYAEEGDNDQAQTYAEMAGRVETGGGVLR
jgi:tetratricopeptide (TPR) repeat protein